MSSPVAGGAGVGLVLGALSAWRWRPALRPLAAGAVAALASVLASGVLGGHGAATAAGAAFITAYAITHLGRSRHG